MLLLGIFILIIFILIYIYLKRQFSECINELPGDKPQLLFGNLLNSGLLTGKKTFHEVMKDYQNRYGDKFIFWFGTFPSKVFCLPEHAQTIFSDRHTFEQSPLFLPNFDLLCPHSIFVQTGPTWKRHIRVMLPMFKRAKIIHYLDSIVECTDRFIDRHFSTDSVHKDLKIHSQSLLLNIIGLIAFNYDFDSVMDPSLKKALEYFNSQATLVMMIPWIPRWLIKFYIKSNWKYQQAHKRIRQLMENIVEQEEMNKTFQENNERPKNLIASLVLSLNEQANDEQISSGVTRAEMLDEILSAILAGYETTSTALAWFIFYMSKHPHIQQRIRQELAEHNLLITDDSSYLPSLTPDKLDALVYCECVTKEVLRLSPIAAVTTRIALRDTTVDNVPIRCGQTILIGIQNIHQDKRFWHHDDPNKFVPERFLGADKDHQSYAMLPFGGGHRACMGQELAWFELKVIIVRLMQRGVIFEDTDENLGGYEEVLTCLPKHLVVRVRISQQQP